MADDNKPTRKTLTPEEREAKRRQQPETALALGSPWLSLAREGAAYARQGARQLRKAVKDGRLRAARIGGKGELFSRREWLDDYMESQAKPVLVNTRRFYGLSRTPALRWARGNRRNRH